jgi:hypothetical protein
MRRESRAFAAERPIARFHENPPNPIPRPKPIVREIPTIAEPDRRETIGSGEAMDERRILEILSEAKELAQQYRALTGKPLGVTGEVAEYEAATLLHLELTPARHDGYDAIRRTDGKRYQIKGRCLLPGGKRSQRLGSIDIDKEFDAVLMVLLDENLNATAIYEADRVPVIAALTAPGSKARNERGALAVSKFKRIGREVWRRQES